MSVKKGKPILRYEQIRKSKKGEKISVWINYSPIYEDEEIIEVATTERDITSEIRSIKTLAENEKKYRELFENVPALVYCVDLKGQIADCNKFACKVLGYTKKELIGKTVFKIYAPGSVAKAKSLFVKWKKNKSLINESLQIMTKKKKIIDVLLNAGLISDESGKPLYSISVQLDISKERKFMRELIEKQMQIEKFSKLTIGRESRIIELKKKIKELEK